MSSADPAVWLAVQVASHNEQNVARQLQMKGEEYFLPTFSSKRRWSDRTVVLELPLFPGYVFCRTKKTAIRQILNTQGVFRIVGFGGQLCPVPDSEIYSLQVALASGRDLQVTPSFPVGQKVRVTQGPLTGVTGVVSQLRSGNRLNISVEMVMSSVSITVDPSELSLVSVVVD